MSWLSFLLALDLAAFTGIRCFLPVFILTLLVRFQKFPMGRGFDFIFSDAFLALISTLMLLELFFSKFIIFNALSSTVYSFLKPMVSAFISFIVLFPGLPIAIQVLAVSILISLIVTLQFHLGMIKTFLYEIKNKTRWGFFLKSIFLDFSVIIFTFLSLCFPVLVFLFIGTAIIVMMRVLKKHGA